MAERRAVELDAGARELGREDVIISGLRVADFFDVGLSEGFEVYYFETGHGYSSCWICCDNKPVVSVDHTTDGLYRLKIERESPKEVLTTNYVDWPELGELFKLLYRHCA